MQRSYRQPTPSTLLWALMLCAALCALPVSEALAQRTKSSQAAGEQRKAEQGLKDNRYYFYFINSSITNFGSDQEKALFRKAIQYDILAQILYMRFEFRNSYVEIRKSQKILIDLFGITLTRDLSTSKKLLDEFAPQAVNSKDNRSRSYLWLGYRDQKAAEINQLIGDNTTVSLYSMRLYQYSKAIKMAKHARRYALLSRIEHQIPLEEQRYTKNLSYDDIDTRLSKMPSSDRIDYYRRVHMDNYYKVTNNRSIYDEVWDNPSLKDLDEYSTYFSKSLR
jgi:hypothetical protein